MSIEVYFIDANRYGYTYKQKIVVVYGLFLLTLLLARMINKKVKTLTYRRCNLLF